MKKQKSKLMIAYEIVNAGNSISESMSGSGRLDKIKREDLVSALVFIQKAEEILKQK